MSDALECKYRALEEAIGRYDKVAVAFSGGVDSTLLLAVAHKVLGPNALAVNVQSYLNPRREIDQAEEFCAQRGIRLLTVSSDELSIPGFAQNPPERCYLCKRQLFCHIKELLSGEGVEAIFEGSNMDDLGDYRPGFKAVQEHGIVSPLQEAGLTKQDIRDLSRLLDLPTWSKPSFACLASRFPFGSEITRQGLARVDAAEQYLLDRGFTQVRVRVHGDVARIELAAEEMDRLYEMSRDGRLSRAFKELGFSFVALDLDGYRTGSLNPAL